MYHRITGPPSVATQPLLGGGSQGTCSGPKGPPPLAEALLAQARNSLFPSEVTERKPALSSLGKPSSLIQFSLPSSWPSFRQPFPNGLLNIPHASSSRKNASHSVGFAGKARKNQPAAPRTCDRRGHHPANLDLPRSGRRDSPCGCFGCGFLASKGCKARHCHLSVN